MVIVFSFLNKIFSRNQQNGQQQTTQLIQQIPISNGHPINNYTRSVRLHKRLRVVCGDGKVIIPKKFIRDNQTQKLTIEYSRPGPLFAQKVNTMTLEDGSLLGDPKYSINPGNFYYILLSHDSNGNEIEFNDASGVGRLINKIKTLESEMMRKNETIKKLEIERSQEAMTRKEILEQEIGTMKKLAETIPQVSRGRKSQEVLVPYPQQFMENEGQQNV